MSDIPVPYDFCPESSCTVAFTGHRTYDGSADAALRVVVRELYDRGMRTFLCGMAVGFDLAAATAVLACRGSMPGIELFAILPFEEQAKRFSGSDRELFRQVLAAADHTVVLSPAYHPGCYAVRNNYLVDHASVVVAWYDGCPGGTAYTVRRASKHRREVINLYSDLSVARHSVPRLF